MSDDEVDFLISTFKRLCHNLNDGTDDRKSFNIENNQRSYIGKQMKISVVKGGNVWSGFGSNGSKNEESCQENADICPVFIRRNASID